MPNRKFEDSALIRAKIKEYLATAKSPSNSGAYVFVEESCVAEGITPPDYTTVVRIIKSMKYSTRLVKEG